MSCHTKRIIHRDSKSDSLFSDNVDFLKPAFTTAAAAAAAAAATTTTTTATTTTTTATTTTTTATTTTAATDDTSRVNLLRWLVFRYHFHPQCYRSNS